MLDHLLEPRQGDSAGVQRTDIIVISLLLLALVCFTSKSLYNYPFTLMAIGGLGISLISPRSTWKQPLVPVFVMLFLFLWLPLLFSLLDAVNPERSLRTVLPYLRFLFAGIFVLALLKTREALGRLNIAIFALITFWCLDAIIQYLFGYNLFGFPRREGYLTGIFHPEITIGHITAVLSPLYFECLRKIGQGKTWKWLLLIPVFVVVLLSGRRAAWIMLSVSSAGYFLYYLKLHGIDKKGMIRLAQLAFVLLAIIVALVVSNPLLQKRIDGLANLASGSYELANKGVGKRLDIWTTSISIYSDNWLNGIGPRGFRYAYAEYSDEDNYFHESGQTHPHQLVLEIMAETGTIGIIGFLAFLVMLSLISWKKNIFLSCYPNLLAIFVAVFPINTHMAFYGSYWSSVFWWLVIVGIVTAKLEWREEENPLA